MNSPTKQGYMAHLSLNLNKKMAQQQNIPLGKYALIIGLCGLCVALGKIWGTSSTASTPVEYDALILDFEQLQLENQGLKIDNHKLRQE